MLTARLDKNGTLYVWESTLASPDASFVVPEGPFVQGLTANGPIKWYANELMGSDVITIPVNLTAIPIVFSTKTMNAILQKQNVRLSNVEAALRLAEAQRRVQQGNVLIPIPSSLESPFAPARSPERGQVEPGVSITKDFEARKVPPPLNRTQFDLPITSPIIPVPVTPPTPSKPPAFTPGISTTPTPSSTESSFIKEVARFALLTSPAWLTFVVTRYYR